MGVFKEIKVFKESKFRRTLQRDKWTFCVPGVNSGVYSPASLHLEVRIDEFKATIFGNLKQKVRHAALTLSRTEFDDLYNEMTKIKELRDNKVFQQK